MYIWNPLQLRKRCSSQSEVVKRRYTDGCFPKERNYLFFLHSGGWASVNGSQKCPYWAVSLWPHNAIPRLKLNTCFFNVSHVTFLRDLNVKLGQALSFLHTVTNSKEYIGQILHRHSCKAIISNYMSITYVEFSNSSF